VVWALLTAAAAAAGGVASRSAAGFYAVLDRPPWAPPAWLFGPAWTVLYVLRGRGAGSSRATGALAGGAALALVRGAARGQRGVDVDLLRPAARELGARGGAAAA
jgi:tryptophan-rich sensory protein